jgi:CrcB protein
MMASLLIAIGGALGSLTRYWINIGIVARIGEVFPWGTVLINISGSLLIGLLASLA